MNKAFNVLLAPDSFKGSLSAIQFCEIATQVIQSIHPDSQVISRPMSDGGEGFVDSFVFAGLAEKQTLWASNALGRKTKAQFAWQPETQTAMIEMAQASGLPGIRHEERNPLQTHTYGTGQMIQAAIALGAKKIILGLGGSATNDGGAGALQALGIPLLDDKGKEINLGGQALRQIKQIGDIPAELLDIEWELACDVTNPLLGDEGATAIFGPQKGVTEHNFEALESGLANWAQVIEEHTGRQVAEIPGAGAAGGMAAGFIGLLEAKVTPGFDILNQNLKIESLLQEHSIDWIVTGEGRIDTQTRFGKLPMRIAELGLKHQVPTIGICGSLQCAPQDLPEFKALFSIINSPMHEIDAFQKTPELLHDTLSSVFNLIG
ncbi:glycerate kinase [Thiomicrorhabdus sp. ZW0627]|uniref:glycerate kinase n=1 Tax=Thiomicrorhabdus sp. ZW0627 TaxID=3039774 RepID=UPI0024369319|nr:glycerate kinase [Thiomicrorhabdus sp. ZW0627]MDG6774453.1 glycerate kinase [Thiomicrorhabdus sp. ZW0627]